MFEGGDRRQGFTMEECWFFVALVLVCCVLVVLVCCVLVVLVCCVLVVLVCCV